MVSENMPIIEALPQALHGEWQRLMARTLENEGELVICLLGAFSVGKSSLLNMLLDEDSLPTGAAETTGLPTFITYASKKSFGYSADGQNVEEVDLKTFQDHTAAAGKPGSFTTLSLPKSWLKGCQLIDLPGLGGTDQARRSFIRAQIDSTDIVIYALEPRGPRREDLEYLRYAQNQGKAIQVVVTQWDRVEAAQERGEHAVDLKQWATQIEEKTGKAMTLLPVSIKGHGKDKLIQFITSHKDQESTIRQARFQAEAAPLFARALQLIDQTIEAQSAASEEERLQLRSEILDQRRVLLEAKQEVYDEQARQRGQLDDGLVSTVNDARQRLESALESLKDELIADPSEERWEPFIEELNLQGQEALTSLIEAISGLHEGLAQDNALQAQWDKVNLYFPKQEKISSDSWNESAQLQRLQEYMLTLSDQIAEHEETLALEIPEGQSQVLIEQLRGLRQQRSELESMPLAYDEIQVGGNSFGSMIGRAVGEVADIGLLFVSPATLAAKLPILIGKGASAAKLTKHAVDALQGFQNIKTGELATRGISAESPVSKTIGMVKYLEKLTFGYWGQQLGSLFDGAPRTVLSVSPESRAHRDQAVHEAEQNIHELQSQLAILHEQESLRDQSEYQLKLKARERATLEQKIQEEKRRIAEQNAHYEAEMAQQFKVSVELEAQKAARRTMNSFDRSARGLEARINHSFKEFWEVRVEEALAEQQEHLNKLLQALESPDETPEEALEALRTQKKVLEQLLQRLESSTQS